jgi:Spy/CpxP family protein refolding chaperone
MRPTTSILAAAVVAIALAAALPMLAQGPGGGPPAGPPGGAPAHDGPGAHFLARLARYLDLDEEQRTEARAIFTAAHGEAAPIRDHVRDLRTQLREALAVDPPDPTAVGNLVVAIDAEREELRGIRQSALDRFTAILTATQRLRLDALRDARRIFGRHRHRGWGGPGAGGGEEPGIEPFGAGA